MLHPLLSLCSRSNSGCVMKQLGYILANDRYGHLEFMCYYEGNEGYSYKQWCLFPEGAVRYASRRQAEKIAIRESRYDGDIFVCQLHDAGKQWVVDPLPLQLSVTV